MAKVRLVTVVVAVCVLAAACVASEGGKPVAPEVAKPEGPKETPPPGGVAVGSVVEEKDFVLKRLTADRADRDISWMPDGQRVLFSRGGKICRLDTRDLKLDQLTDGPYDGEPFCSPDGKWIAFARSGPREEFPFGPEEWEFLCWRVWLMEADGSHARVLFPEGWGLRPRGWREDGRELWVAVGGFTLGLGILDIATGEARGIGFTVPPEVAWARDEGIGDVAFSPDGKWVAFHASLFEGPNELWVADVDGTNARMVDNWAWSPTWSRDGRRLFYKRDSAIWSMDLAGGEAAVYFDLLVVQEYAFSPGQERLVVVAGRRPRSGLELNGLWLVEPVD